jgi:transposase
MSEREAELEIENAQLREENAELRKLVAELRQQNAKLRKQVFGPTSERHIDHDSDKSSSATSDMPMSPIAEPPLASADTPVSPQETPEKPASAKHRSKHGRRRRPANLTVHREVLDLREDEKPCPCCGTLRERIGHSEPSRRYDFIPASIIIRETVRVTYACHSCEKNAEPAQIERPSLPPEPIPRSSAAPGLLAHIIVSKMADHLPLYRQETILERAGFAFPRSTMCDWMLACTTLLDPLYQLMLKQVKQSYVLHVDDTPVSLMNPKRSAYAWVAVGDIAHPYIVFDFTPGRGAEHPERFLKDFQGFLQTDGYSGYNAVHGHVRHVGCWMHVRRYFFDERNTDRRALDALSLIRRLYAIEKEATRRRLEGDSLTRHRQLHSLPVLQDLEKWLKLQQASALPASGFGKAVNYALNQWPSLVRYASDGRLSVDNGVAERAIRPLALGRKNWLFIGGDRGLSAAAVLRSVVASATRHGWNEWEYLRDVLTRMSSHPPNSELVQLLPDRWKPPAK